jgi:hypothetical protein
VIYPLRSFSFSGLDELLWDPSTNFELPSYVEAQAWALTSLPSFLSWIVFRGYDLGVKSYFNDEALEDLKD